MRAKMRTISIKEFRNLVTHSEDKVNAFGNFALGKKSHAIQCETLRAGHTVFYIEISDGGIGEDGRQQIPVTVVEATIVDEVEVGL